MRIKHNLIARIFPIKIFCHQIFLAFDACFNLFATVPYEYNNKQTNKM